MQKLLIYSCLAGFLCLVWSNLSWMVFKLHNQSLHSFKDQIQVQEILQANMLPEQSAVYALPSMHSKKESKPSLEGGPRAFVAIVPHAGPFNPMKLLKEFIYNTCIAFILGSMLTMANFENFDSRFSFTMLFGLANALSSFLPNWNWWGFALDYTLIGITDSLMYALIIAVVFASTKTFRNK